MLSSAERNGQRDYTSNLPNILTSTPPWNHSTDCYTADRDENDYTASLKKGGTHVFRLLLYDNLRCTTESVLLPATEHEVLRCYDTILTHRFPITLSFETTSEHDQLTHFDTVHSNTHIEYRHHQSPSILYENIDLNICNSKKILPRERPIESAHLIGTRYFVSRTAQPFSSSTHCLLDEFGTCNEAPKTTPFTDSGRVTAFQCVTAYSALVRVCVQESSRLARLHRAEEILSSRALFPLTLFHHPHYNIHIDWVC